MGSSGIAHVPETNCKPSFPANGHTHLHDEETKMPHDSKRTEEVSDFVWLTETEIWLKEGLEHQVSSVSDTRASSKWRARRHRVKLLQDIFHACDHEDRGRLCASQ